MHHKEMSTRGDDGLSWVRTLPGSQRLRALIVCDEVYGFLPPHPANPRPSDPWWP